MEVASLYNEQFMDHVAHPDYKYELDDATHTHDGVNPSCGDELHLAIRLGEDGLIEEVAYTGHGCAVSMASADIMSDLMVGKTPQQAMHLCELFKGMITGGKKDDATLDELDEAALLKDVSHMPARVKCAELAWRTLAEMLKDEGDSGVTTTE